MSSVRFAFCRAGQGPAPPTHLEDQLHAELDLARTAQVAAGGSSGQNLSEVRGHDVVRRLCEVRMVEQIEGFGAELQGEALLDLSHLGDGAVDILEARSGQDIAACVAERAGR